MAEAIKTRDFSETDLQTMMHTTHSVVAVIEAVDADVGTIEADGAAIAKKTIGTKLEMISATATLHEVTDMAEETAAVVKIEWKPCRRVNSTNTNKHGRQKQWRLH